MVAKPAGNDAVVHDRLVGLVEEVRLPALGEVRRRPRLKLLELSIRRADLDASVDAVGGERTSAVESPLVKDL